MRAWTYIAGTVGIAVVAAPAIGWAEVTEDGAAGIRDGIQEWIDTNLRAGDEQSITFDGEIEVVPADGVYAVTIPPAEIAVDVGSVLRFDAIEIELAPLDNGWYDATWTLPDTYTIENARTEESGTITIAGQHGSGVFAPEYETFMELDTALEGIEVLPPREAGSLTIGLAAMVADSVELEDGVYDSVFEFVMEDVAFEGEGPEESFDMALMSLEGAVAAIDMDQYITFVRAFDELTAQAEAGEVEPQSMFGQMAGLVEQTSNLFDAFSFDIVVEDVTVVDAEQTVTIGDSATAISIEGLTGETSTLRVAYDLTDLGIDPAPVEQQFLPQQTTVELAMVGLPNDQLIEVLETFLLMSAETNPDDAMMMATMQLQQAVMAGGTTLQIEDITVISDLASLEMDGVVEPDPNAAFGVTAEADMVIAGLADLISEMQTMPEGQDAIPFLTLIQSMGAQATDDEGRQIRTYELVVTAEGTFMLNGTDMGPMLQQMQ
jgi:hypothetical protein